MKRETLVLLRGVILALTMATLATLTSCTSVPVASGSSSSEAATSRELTPSARVLGTGWGESRDSRVTMTSFERANTKPDGTGLLRYMDFSGFDSRTARRSLELAGGLVSVGLKGSSGRWLPTSRAGFVSGEEGERYEIVVRNLTPHRIEVVVSVDGLDVLDGRSASYAKRGHLIEGKGTIKIAGWRTSTSSVAAFRFASKSDSYAERKHGDSRNVGVIGVAVFKQKGRPAPVFAQPPPGGAEPNPFPGERWARSPQG